MLHEFIAQNSSVIANDLHEAGVARPMEKTTLLRGSKTLHGANKPKWYTDEKEMQLLEKSTQPSRVDPQRTVLQRQNLLSKAFKVRFDELLRNTRAGFINKDNFSHLKNICADLDFDFLVHFPGQNYFHAFNGILTMAFSDVRKSVNKTLEPCIVDETTQNQHRLELRQYSCQEVKSAKVQDLALELREEFEIPASRSYDHAKLTTKIAIDLLRIANSKGVLAQIEDEFITESPVYNLDILDWFIDETCVAEMQDINVIGSSGPNSKL